jgi:hypothetical protein
MRLLAAALLRLCFPSWKFFDSAGTLPELQVRRLGHPDTAHGWVPALGPSTRPPWALLFNPAGTERLAAQSIVERFDLSRHTQDVTRAEHTTAALLVQHLAEMSVPAEWRNEPGAGWEWRVVHTGTASDAEDDSHAEPTK